MPSPAFVSKPLVSSSRAMGNGRHRFPMRTDRIGTEASQCALRDNLSHPRIVMHHLVDSNRGQVVIAPYLLGHCCFGPDHLETRRPTPCSLPQPSREEGFLQTIWRIAASSIP